VLADHGPQGRTLVQALRNSSYYDFVRVIDKFCRVPQKHKSLDVGTPGRKGRRVAVCAKTNCVFPHELCALGRAQSGAKYAAVSGIPPVSGTSLSCALS
jgi:hypothetical protein